MASLEIHPAALKEFAVELGSATAALMSQCGEVSAALSSARNAEAHYAGGVDDVLSSLGTSWDIQLESITANLNDLVSILTQVADLFSAQEAEITAAAGG